MRKIYRYKLLVVGLISAGLAISLLSTIWTPKSGLVKISGRLTGASTYVTTASDSRGNASQRSELVFFIEGYDQKYSLVENIGDQVTNVAHEEILRALRSAETVDVWLRKREAVAYAPKVFQIGTDRGIILAFEDVRTNDRPIAVFLFIAGLGSIGAFFYFHWRES